MVRWFEFYESKMNEHKAQFIAFSDQKVIQLKSLFISIEETAKAIILQRQASLHRFINFVLLAFILNCETLQIQQKLIPRGQ